jgi:hypothetical protein
VTWLAWPDAFGPNTWHASVAQPAQAMPGTAHPGLRLEYRTPAQVQTPNRKLGSRFIIVFIPVAR